MFKIILSIPLGKSIFEAIPPRFGRGAKAHLDQLCEGDTIIVVTLDRLDRKTTEILAIIEDLQKRNVDLVSDQEGVDYCSPTGRLVIQILVSVAEMERSLITERTKAGLAVAREKGRLIGRKSFITVQQWV